MRLKSRFTTWKTKGLKGKFRIKVGDRWTFDTSRGQVSFTDPAFDRAWDTMKHTQAYLRDAKRRGVDQMHIDSAERQLKEAEAECNTILQREMASLGKSLTSRLVTKMSTDAVLTAVEELGRGGYGLVSLAALGHKLGTTPAQLHAAVQQLRRQGKISASGAEGRQGITPEEQRWLLHEPDEPHGIGYVSPRR